MKTHVLCVAGFLILLCAHSNAKDQQATVLSVRAVAYRAIPHQITSSYTTPGRSNTSCFGSASGTATHWGFMTDFSMSTSTSCSTVTTPPEVRPISIAWLEVYNMVEANGQAYTIRCTASWVGSACNWLTPGDTFSAEVRDTTMWVTAHRGGNMGKQIRAKFAILDLRPMPSAALKAGTTTPPDDTPQEMAATFQRNSGNTVASGAQPRREEPSQSVSASNRSEPATTNQPSANPWNGTCDLSPTEQSGLTAVTICSVPLGATVVIHGSAIGRTPHTILLEPGIYNVKVLASGYFEWSHTVRVEAGMPQAVMAQLKTVEQKN